MLEWQEACNQKTNYNYLINSYFIISLPSNMLNVPCELKFYSEQSIFI